MQQFLTDFIHTAGSALYLIILYGAFFYGLYFFTDKNSARKPVNFKRADSEDKFFSKDFKLELYYYLFHKLVTNIVLTFALGFITIYVLQKYVPFQIFADQIQSLPFALQLLLGLLIADAAFFFPHWFSHKFLWRFHSIHHSAEKLTWITAMRLHPVDQIGFALGSAIGMHVLGFEGDAIILAIIIHNTYNLFVHANISIDYPKPLCYILGSPNYHRWHHAADKEAIDKNMATMFPVFDLIFGTYYYPQGKLPESYGLYGKDEQKNFPKTFGKQLIYPFKKKR